MTLIVYALSVFVMCISVKVESTTMSQQEMALQACEGGINMTGETGNISTPNYPNNYETNLQCTWIVSTQPNKVIRVWFIDQNIEPNTGCIYDYLSIQVENELLGGRKYCGIDKPRDFVTDAQSITFFFKSDGTIQRTGFFATWNLLDACSSTEFTCWNGDCIPISQRCDRVNDCGDDSDEIECTHNTSNANECGRPSVATKFSWNARIIGGNNAVQGAFPWQVMLVYSSTQKHFCAGSIIAKKWVVTAAHCTNNLLRPSDVIVYVGRHNYAGNNLEVSHNVDKYIVHENYFKWTLRSDIAMFHLNTSIEYTDLIKPICLPSLNSTFQLQPGRICIATGWGSIYPNKQVFPDRLRQVRVPIVKTSQCASLYKADGQGTIPSKTICAGDTVNGGVDSCVGDSGGPLACLVSETAFYLFGITSFGKGCADRRYPGVYTAVAEYRDWIEIVMEENDQNDKSPDEANVPDTVAPTTSHTSELTQVAFTTPPTVNTQTTSSAYQTTPSPTQDNITQQHSSTSLTTSDVTTTIAKTTSTTDSYSEKLTTVNASTVSLALTTGQDPNQTTTSAAVADTVDDNQLASTVLNENVTKTSMFPTSTSTGNVVTSAVGGFPPNDRVTSSTTSANLPDVPILPLREEQSETESTVTTVQGAVTSGVTSFEQHFCFKFVLQSFLIFLFVTCF